MKINIEKVIQFLKCEEGATAVEYAVMVALMIVVSISAITTLGSKVSSTFSSTASKITTTTTASWSNFQWIPGQFDWKTIKKPLNTIRFDNILKKMKNNPHIIWLEGNINLGFNVRRVLNDKKWFIRPKSAW